MSEALGVSRGSLSLYEADKVEPRWGMIAQLVDILGVPFSVFTRQDIDWHEVERLILEKRLRDHHRHPYVPQIDLAKDNVKSNYRQLVAVP